jgi:hypothetical protein
VSQTNQAATAVNQAANQNNPQPGAGTQQSGTVGGTVPGASGGKGGIGGGTPGGPQAPDATKFMKQSENQESFAGLKKGGVVKAKAKVKAKAPVKKTPPKPKLSQAAVRGDGIAQRGRTKGRMI